MLKKGATLLGLLFALNACTKNNAPDATAGAPLSAVPHDVAAQSLLALYNSQTPQPVLDDGTLVFTAPNGDTLSIRRNRPTLTVKAAPFMTAGVTSEKILGSEQWRSSRWMREDGANSFISFSQTLMQTDDYLETSAQWVVESLVQAMPPVSADGVQMILSDDFVRLTWNAETLAWSIGMNANLLADVGLDMGLLKGYELKDGFLMNIMQPIS